MDALKDIVQVLATTALLWVGRAPSHLLLSPPTPTQPFEVMIPTVTVYAPSRCLPVPSSLSVSGHSASDAHMFHQIVVYFFGLSIFGFFSLALGAFCLSVHRTHDSLHLRASPPSEASPIVTPLAIDRVAEVWTKLEADHRKIIQELSVKTENLEGQIIAKASEIKSLKFLHECQLASTWSAFESQKSQSTAAYRALEVERQNIGADLRARIAQLEQQTVDHAAIVEQASAAHKRELEGARAKHRSAIQTLTSLHETKTTNLAKELVEMQVLATRLDTDLHRALKENQKLESSTARLTELNSSQSTTSFELKAQLEVTSNRLKDAIQEKASAQNRLAAAQEEVESISTRLYDAMREHTAAVRQRDDMIKKNFEAMTTLESELVQQRDKAAQLASQTQLLDAEITAKDTEISTLTSSLSIATSKLLELEAQNVSCAFASADAVVQTDNVDNEDARTEVDVEVTTPLFIPSACPDPIITPLTRSHSMTIPSPTSSPGSLLRRHSLNVIIERAKQTLEEATVATAENLEMVAAGEAAVEEALLQTAGPESPEPLRPSTNESGTVGPTLAEQKLSGSMWAPCLRPVKHELPPRPNFEPQMNWAAEAATRKHQTGAKIYQTTPHKRNVDQQRPRWGDDRQGFAAFNTAQRVASGKAGGTRVTKNSKKDVRHISREGDYKFHDYR
ncbi:hypothetical protein M407DRAFT_11270 [Tulasnella calospora MUT 4182]|uniref:Uncharacterized protein n=1 Tax=Tulasnella calospora MUT 4182 TaxID=1051891 RepID=A0A0C3Q700_9AGAM|nr:hypothetical protein M407DRAFT_11270 [Tulasnella calospora MUT 4182]